MTGQVARTDLLCACLQVLISSHRWGSPLTKEEVVSRAGVAAHDRGALKDAYEEVRELPFIADEGARGIYIDDQETLAIYLYRVCGWEKWIIRTRLKHAFAAEVLDDLEDEE